MQFDSIAENNRVDIVKTKIIYIIEDGRIYRKIIPKKEYTEFKKSVESYFKFGEFESFWVYKEKGLEIYYQKEVSYSCD